MACLHLSPDVQQRYRNEIEGVFAKLGLQPPAFHLVDNSGVLVGEFRHNGRLYQIEIQSGNVVMVGGEQLFECYLRSEFRDEQSLINGFAARLERYLSAGLWRHPDERGLSDWLRDAVKKVVG